MSDKALSFHWQTDAEALGFLGDAAFNETVRAIVTEAYLVARADPEQWISYSRNKDFYRRTRYRRTSYSYTSVTRAVDFLAHEDLLEHRKAAQGQLGWQSTFRASPKLMAAIDPAMAITFETVETVVLRDRKDKTALEYSDTRQTVRLRRHLTEINEALSSVEIAHPDLGTISTGSPTRIGDANPGPAQQTLCRVFSGNFNQGGRFYGAFWIGLPSRERVRLTLAGQDVVEHDYKAIHPTLLYAEAGVALDGDAYEIPGYPAELRKLIKIAFNTMVNASDRKSAAWAILQRARTLAESNVIPPGYCSPQAIGALLDAIEKHHHHIRKAFYSDAGIKLQRIDSSMAENVLLDLTRQDIPTLPVHDSFIAPQQHASHLEEAMQKALKTALKNDDAASDFSRHVSASAEREISPSDLHIASDLQNEREPTPETLALAWHLASQMAPSDGLALLLGVSGVFQNFGRAAHFETAAA